MVQSIPSDVDVVESPYELYLLTFADWNWDYYDELNPKLKAEIAVSPEFFQLSSR